MLHLIFQSPLQQAVLERIDTKDAVIFFENALLGLLETTQVTLVHQCLQSQALYVLESDIKIRGINQQELFNGVKVIDYAAFVTLTTQHALIQTWN